MTYLSYLGFRIFIAIFYLIPFWVIYLISDLLYYLLYYLIKYRRKTVRENIKIAYPDWKEKDRIILEKKFYRHLADIFMEGIKAINLSDKETIKRYKITTPEAPNIPYSKGSSSLFVGSHQNNWEYGALGCGLQIDPIAMVFYKPIKNPLINDYIRNSRKDKGTIMAPISETSEYFEKYYEQRPMYIMISDQSPSNVKDCHWIEFFGKETAVLHGPAKYAQKYNLPIYLIKTEKKKRGFYLVSARLLIENPIDYSQEEISRIFTEEIEKQIREAPEFWLWSHKRWKRKRES
jgi:KDO2-lipid IV(A) lauroyltransferase